MTVATVGVRRCVADEVVIALIAAVHAPATVLGLCKNEFIDTAAPRAPGFYRAIRRAPLVAVFDELEPCLVGMEACGSSHHWARELSKLGHDARLIPANYVKPYVKRGKSDAVDAEAICEAVTRPTMRFVSPNSEAQQAVLFLRRARDFIVSQRTQLSNMLRSLLVEFGIIIAPGTESAVKFAKSLLDGDRPTLPEIARDVLKKLGH